MQFDGSWTSYLPYGSSAPSAAQFPVLTNGSIAVVPSVDTSSPKSAGVDTSVSVMGSASGFSRSTFQFARVRASVGGVELNQQLGVVGSSSLALNMQTGVFTLNATDSGTGCTVKHELRALMQFPGMVLHTVTVVVPASVGSSTVSLKLMHEVRAPTSNTGKTYFSGDTIYVSPSSSQFVLAASNDCSACVSMYLPQTSLSSAAAYNETSTGGRKAWAVLPISQTSTSGVATTFVTHVLTAVSPVEGGYGSTASITAAMKRRLLGILASATTTTMVAQSLISGHTSAWAARWATYVDIPTGATSSTLWALRYAFYNLHSCVRHSGPPAFVDLAGTTLGSAARGDDFLVNALLFVSPGAAKTLLEERWRILPIARQIALGDGLDGARFPYAREPSSLDDDDQIETDDSYSGQNNQSSWNQAANAVPPVGDGDDPQDGSSTYATDGGDPWLDGPSAGSAWQTTPVAIRVYGTLMTAVDAWNYFRVSKDVDWLADRGWVILKAAADLVCSMAAPLVQPTTPTILSQTPSIPLSGSTCVGVVGMDVSRSPATNPAAVVAAAVAVLRGAVEASYALGYSAPQVSLWNAVRYGLVLTTVSASGMQIVASDASTSGLGPLAIPEPLIALMEPLASLSSSLTNTTTLLNNAVYWTNASNRYMTAGSNASPRDVAIGDLVSLQAIARLSQSTSSYAATFLSSLNSILTSHVDLSGFGNIRPAGGPTAAPNDLGMSALFVLAFLQGLGGGTVSGGYTSGQLTYAPLGITTSASAVLPSGWERLVFYGIGPQQVDAVLLNGSTGASGGTGTFVPWSVNNFV